MSTRILILKDGVITPSRSDNDITTINTSLGITASLALKANLISPALTGTPTAPTATAGTNTTQIANTTFVSTAISNLVASSPAALDTLNELAAALGNDANFSTTVTNALASRVNVTTNQTIGGIKTFSNLIRIGASGQGSIILWPGNSTQTGYIEFYRADSVTRTGYIGFDNINMTYVSDNGGIHVFSGGAVRVTNTTESTSTTTGASIISGGQGITGNLNIGGFTSLGDNVAIKIKYLVGTTSSTDGGSVTIAHGLDSLKIINCSTIIEWTSGGFLHHSYTASPGFQFNVFIDANSIGIRNVAGNSSSILSKIVRIVLFYII